MSDTVLRFKWASTVVILLVLLSGNTQLVSAVYGTFQDLDLGFLVSPKFSSDWAVEVTEEGGSSTADQLARKHGFINLGQIGNLKNFFHFKLVLNTSDVVDSDNDGQHQAKTRSIGSWKEITEQPHLTHALKQNNGVGFVEQQRIMKYSRMGIYSRSTDPLWPNQWSLLNTGQTEGPRGKDLNVEPVWMQGVTGSGVVVAFVDNGLEKAHPDLSNNYDPRASWDFVNNDGDPTPDNYFGDEPDSHGTECAGQVGMVKDNGKCGVGIAHNSRIGGLKLHYGFVTDIIDAGVLGHNHNHIDVNSNSRGLLSYGFFVGGPQTLARKALETGVKEGRNKKGVVYTFATGNDGESDSCAANGYVTSIYTIAVGSANQNGEQAVYDEQCAAKMVVTFALNRDTFPSASDDWKAFKQITTTTLNGQCTDSFTGTSSSTPHVSGVIALALQANPNLTWRDVQYLLAYTSNPDSLLDGEWTTNGGGLKVSHKFGFGAVDAEALVTRARRWINVPEQKSQTIVAAEHSDVIPSRHVLTTTFYVAVSSVTFLEHVVLTTTLNVNHDITQSVSYADIISHKDDFNGNYYQLVTHLHEYYNGYPKRGDIKIELTSPQGTVSTMLPYRTYDFVNDEGYDSWPFMSVHHWGENPIGQWTVKLQYNSPSGSLSYNGLDLTLYGTSETPQAVSNIPAVCNLACARGCSGPRALDCDVCREYRISSTLDCVSTCPQESTIEVNNGYCLDGSTPAPVPKEDSSVDHLDGSTPTPVPEEDSSVDHLVIIVSGAGSGALLLFILVVGCGCLVFCYRKKNRSYRSQGFTRFPSEDASTVPV